MGKYLKKFNTHADYETFISDDFIKPNVSYCVQENEVHYNPYVDPCQQHDYVEIGGIKWATKNVGACDVTDIGVYFQWGDTQGYTADQIGSGEGQKYFGWTDYKYSNNGGSTVADMTKYNSVDGKTVLDVEDDAVVANWGGNWRMATEEEFQTLGDAVNTTWTDDYQGSGIAGLVCTDKTDSSKVLFFPAAGKYIDGNLRDNNISIVWSSSCLDRTASAYVLYNSQDYSPWIYYTGRNQGVPVRGILDE